MRLLLVDDERHTRNFIKSGVSWQKLGITMVEEANNGKDAIDILLKLRPEIILTDIKMPLMDGIELAKRARELTPNCRIIFMSAFSDKEYLKSAISLRINEYVEKPINLEELQKSLVIAVSECENIEKKQTEERLISKRLSESIPVLKSDIAKSICTKNNNYESIRDMIKHILPSVNENCVFVSVVFSIRNEGTEFLQTNIQYIQYEIEKYLAKFNFESLIFVKDNNHIVAHITNIKNISQNSYYMDLNDLFKNFIKKFASRFVFFISIGNPVTGIHNIYKSYINSIITQQKLFFYGYNTVMTYKTQKEQNSEIDKDIVSDFESLLFEEKYVKAIYLISNFVKELSKRDFIMINKIKSCFSNICWVIAKMSPSKGVDIYSNEGGNAMIWEVVNKTQTLTELEQLVIQKIKLLEEEINRKNKYGKYTKEIIRIIKSSYSKQELSVKTISEELFMNKAYLCVIFKKDTGKTINQFLTEYRVEKSLDLLQIKEKKISEVANCVGFINSNYYTKVFKNHYGFIPSKYREKIK